ncbi:MAG: hypothetical protein ABFD77_02370 [Thermotogota bacterium]
MRVRDQLIRRIESLPEDVLEQVYDFVTFIQERKLVDEAGNSWGSFALGSRSFEFWNDREEAEYSLADLRPTP